MTYKYSILTNVFKHSPLFTTTVEITVTMFDRVLDQYSSIAWLTANHCLCLSSTDRVGYS